MKEIYRNRCQQQRIIVSGEIILYMARFVNIKLRTAPTSRITSFGYKTSRLIPRARRAHNAHVKRQRLKQLERQDAINKRNNKRARHPKKDRKLTKMNVG